VTPTEFAQEKHRSLAIAIQNAITEWEEKNKGISVMRQDIIERVGNCGLIIDLSKAQINNG
jgi:hypothetical protein